MTPTDFAGFITRLPQADIPMAGVTAYLLAAPQGQAVFFKLPAGASVPPHSHGAQWGMVVQGEILLTIDGVEKTYRKGDDYYIGSGVVHSGVIKTDSLVIDVFADPGRYNAKA
ncbi:MAG: cupin domain-containing protein [Desulfarculus sp.]|nr:cupin domain-containing protein [Desulfarculus sp.]